MRTQTNLVMALAAQCELGSRHACDEAELEGLRPAAAVALPLPALPTLALAVSLLLAIISSLIKRTRRASSRSQQPGPGVRGRYGPLPCRRSPLVPAALQIAPRNHCPRSHPLCRRLAAQVNPTTPAAQQAAPLPLHPAAAGTSFVAQRRSPAAAALLGAADAAASMLLLPVSVLQTAKHVLLGQRAGTAAPRTPETAGGLGSQHHGGGGGSGSGRRIAHYGLGYGACSWAVPPAGSCLKQARVWQTGNDRPACCCAPACNSGMQGLCAGDCNQ